MDASDFGRHERAKKRAAREARGSGRSATERALAPAYTAEERRQLHGDARLRALELRHLAHALAAQCDVILEAAIPPDDDTACALIGHVRAATHDASSIGAAGSSLMQELARVIDAAYNRARGDK